MPWQSCDQRFSVDVLLFCYSYFTSYVSFFYPEEKHVAIDEELAAFWECVDLWGGKGTPWRYGLPALCKASLVDYLTHLAFQVTAWHELVGTIIQYLLPNKKGAGPAHGMGFTVRGSQERNDVQVL